MRRQTRPLPLARRVPAAVAVVGAVVASTVSCALAAPTVAVAAPAPAAGTGTVVGTVRSGDLGLVGVVVTARTPAERVLATTATRDDGSYTLTGVPSGLRSICFDGATVTTTPAPLGYSRACFSSSSTAALATPVRVPAGGTARGIDGLLSPLAALAGVVTDTSGAPVPGVVVRPVDGSPSSTTSGADGRYRLTVAAVSPTTFTPCFDPTGVVTASAPAGLLSACQADPLPVGPGGTVTVDQVLTPGAAVAGRVTDPGGTPVTGVRVVVSRPTSQDRDGVVVPGVTVGTAVTTADGRYRVAGLPPRTDLVVGFDGRSVSGGASPTGYLAQCWDAPVTDDVTACAGQNFPGRTLSLAPTATRAGVDGRLTPAGVLFGAVRDAGGEGVPGLRVVVRPDGGSRPLVTTSGPGGAWELGGLRPTDTYTVCADGQLPPAPVPQPDPDGYEGGCHGPAGTTGATPVTVLAGERVGPVDVVVTGHGAIGGRVVDGSGRPVTGMTVSWTGPGEGSAHGVLRTGDDGRFRIGALRVAAYDVCLAADADTTPHDGLGLAPRCEYAVAVAEDATADLGDLTVVEGGVISGRIADAGGYPLVSSYLSVTDLATGRSTVRQEHAMGDGTYATDVLAPGRYAVCVYGGHRIDGTVPPRGFARQCWKQKVEGATPTPVRVASGVTVTGVDFRLRPVAG